MEYLNSSPFRQVDTESGIVYEPGVYTPTPKETAFVTNQVASGLLLSKEDASKPAPGKGPVVTATGRTEEPIVNSAVNSDADGNKDALDSAKEAEKKPEVVKTVADEVREKAVTAANAAAGGGNTTAAQPAADPKKPDGSKV